MTRTPSTSKGLPPSAAAMDDAAIIAPDSGKVADVTILSTGSANLASVVAAFERLGSRATITTDPLIAERAELLVLPGVGSLGSAMASLGQRGLIEMIRRRWAWRDRGTRRALRVERARAADGLEPHCSRERMRHAL